MRFGRAPKFLIYDTENNTFVLIDNKQNLAAAQGAGIQSAQCVIEAGAQALILRHCGPKAFRVLATAGVAVYLSEALTLGEALEQYKAEKLKRMQAADVEGHWA